MTDQKQFTDRLLAIERRSQERLDKQLTLPFPNDDLRRFVPNGTLRGALFAVVGKGRNKSFRQDRIPSLEGTEIFYTGVQLTQHHLDFWATLVHVSAPTNLGHRVEITAHRFLQLMGLEGSKENYTRLWDHLADLRATSIDIRCGTRKYLGGLVQEAAKDEETGKLVVILNQKMVALFQNDQFSEIDWEVRNQLSGSLAKWLHSFYSTHDNPYVYKVSTIHELCGSSAKDVVNFQNTTLKKAIAELNAICSVTGRYMHFELKDAKLYVTRSKSTAPPLLQAASKPNPKRQNPTQ